MTPRCALITVVTVAILAGCTDPPPARTVDLQAHRGGRGLTVEESLPGYAKALRLGVDTLELDVTLTADDVPLLWHDPIVEAEKCADTAPAFPNDPRFPYVGKVIHDLTAVQVHMLDCGRTIGEFPGQQALPGNRIATLPELFALAGRLDADVRFNIETKVEADHPDRSATPAEFVDTILAAVEQAGLADRVAIQSFDWRVLPLVRAKNPTIGRVALYNETTYVPDSPWLGPIRYTDHPGDPFEAAKAIGANSISPRHQLVTGRDYIDRAHHAGLKVIPWTVNSPERMGTLLDLGVDGLITDYPDRAREVMAAKGFRLPTPATSAR